MCHAIVKVQYHNDREPVALLEVESIEMLPAKIEEVKGRPGVRKVTIFYPSTSHEIVSEWKVTQHGEGT